MSEQNDQHDGQPEGAQAPAQPGQDAPVPSGQEEPRTFDAAYVKGLRDEAAANRVRASRADELSEGWLRAARELATAGILIDPEDLPRSDDHLNDDGSPNLDKIRDAALELANQRPHLARPRVPVQGVQGPIGQQPDQPVSLGALLRGAAS